MVGDSYIADQVSRVTNGATIRNRRLARLGASGPDDALRDIRDEKIVVGVPGCRGLSDFLCKWLLGSAAVS